MGRVNKSTDGVFVDIVGTTERIPAYQQFINQEFSTEETGSDREIVLASMIFEYENKVSKHKLDFQHLALMETIIMQLRTRLNFKDTVKLYYVNKKSGVSYIYARCPFYRTWSDTNEVRVLIDKTELHTESPTDEALSILSGNPEFMKKVYDEITEVMDGEINESLRTYKKTYQN